MVSNNHLYSLLAEVRTDLAGRVRWMQRSVETKPLAKPAQNAGGYSLSIPVAHSPVAVLPMLAPRGMVMVSCHFLSSSTMQGMFQEE